MFPTHESSLVVIFSVRILLQEIHALVKIKKHTANHNILGIMLRDIQYQDYNIRNINGFLQIYL